MPLQWFMAIMQPNLDWLVMFALDKLLQMATNCRCTSQPGAGITENTSSPLFLPLTFLFSFIFTQLICVYIFPNTYYPKTTKHLKALREQSSIPALR